MLEDHLKNVQDELATTQVGHQPNAFDPQPSFLLLQRLFTARKNEAETEEHLKMLNEREFGRLKQDILRLENDLTGTKDRKSSLAVSAKHLI
jgi:hypothetical protein